MARIKEEEEEDVDVVEVITPMDMDMDNHRQPLSNPIHWLMATPKLRCSNNNNQLPHTRHKLASFSIQAR